MLLDILNISLHRYTPLCTGIFLRYAYLDKIWYIIVKHAMLHFRLHTLNCNVYGTPYVRRQKLKL